MVDTGEQCDLKGRVALGPPSALFATHGGWGAYITSVTSGAVLWLRLSGCVASNQGLDAFPLYSRPW